MILEAWLVDHPGIPGEQNSDQSHKQIPIGQFARVLLPFFFFFGGGAVLPNGIGLLKPVLPVVDLEGT